jgi:hypothetical protein
MTETDNAPAENNPGKEHDDEHRDMRACIRILAWTVVLQGVWLLLLLFRMWWLGLWWHR